MNRTRLTTEELDEIAEVFYSLNEEEMAYLTELSQKLKDRYRRRAEDSLKDINDAGFAVRSFMKRGPKRDPARKKIARKYLYRRKGILRSIRTDVKH